jgi:hypothetical protein
MRTGIFIDAKGRATRNSVRNSAGRDSRKASMRL